MVPKHLAGGACPPPGAAAQTKAVPGTKAAPPRPRAGVRICCAPRLCPHAAFRLANIHLKNQMKAEILFPKHAATSGMGEGRRAPPRSGAGLRRRRQGRPLGCERTALPAARGPAGLGRGAALRVSGALPQSWRARGAVLPACRRSTPALQSAGGGAGMTACVCVPAWACARVCTRAARPPRPSLLGAAVPRPLPFAPPVLPLTAAAHASPPPSSSQGEICPVTVGVGGERGAERKASASLVPAASSPTQSALLSHRLARGP